MSEVITIEEIPQAPPPAPRTWAEPNEKGQYPEDALEHIYAPALLGALLLIEQADGWRSGWEAALPEAAHIDAPTVLQIPRAREIAITEACERLIGWCAEQKTRGKRKHKEAADQLQVWALGLEDRAKFADQIAAAPGPELISLPEVIREGAAD